MSQMGRRPAGPCPPLNVGYSIDLPFATCPLNWPPRLIHDRHDRHFPRFVGLLSLGGKAPGLPRLLAAR